jgi:HlyD family secretion protein
LIAGGIVTLVALAAAGTFSLLHAADGAVLVDRSTIVTDVVQRGTLERSISAAGSLAAEDVHVVSAVEPGVVATVDVKPGAAVRAGDSIARLENPDLDAAVIDARSSLTVAQAQLASAQEQAAASALTQQSALAQDQAQMQEDVTNAESLATLHRGGMVADSTFRIAQIHAATSQRQVQIGRAEVSVGAADARARVAAAQAEVDRASALLDAREAQLAALTVRARAAGVVQTVAVEPGAHVDVGAQLAQIADQRALEAVLAVAESEAHDVVIGMTVLVDTGNGTATGHVTRIAPTAQNGSVAVDVRFDRSLPPGARPDLTVDGTIELERIPDAVYVARPAGVADDSTADVYRLDASGTRAALARVSFGRGSNDRIEVRSGLAPGDGIIISDTSSYGGRGSLRFH